MKNEKLRFSCVESGKYVTLQPDFAAAVATKRCALMLRTNVKPFQSISHNGLD